LHTSCLAIVCQWKNGQLAEQLRWATKLSDKIAQLCSVSDMGLTVTPWKTARHAAATIHL